MLQKSFVLGFSRGRVLRSFPGSASEDKTRQLYCIFEASLMIELPLDKIAYDDARGLLSRFPSRFNEPLCSLRL